MDAKLKMKCYEQWEMLDPETRLQMSQYDLARQTAVEEVSAWVEFLREPEIMDAIQEELHVFKEAQTRKLIGQADKNNKSVGMAQLIGALDKVTDKGAKTGDTIVYCHIPFTNKDKAAPNGTEERSIRGRKA